MPATYAVNIDWDDDGDFSDTGEDVTADVDTVGAAITIAYGRDQARAMSPIAPGQAAFDLDNDSRTYSPENTSSPLYGSLAPGRAVRITAAGVVGGGTNLVANGEFEENPNGWYARGDITPGQTSAEYYSGFHAGMGIVGATPLTVTDGMAYGVSSFRGFPVSPSTTYGAQAQMKATAGVDLDLSVIWRTSAGAFISSSVIQSGPATGGWDLRSGVATSPATAAEAQVLLRTDNTSVTFYADDVRFQEATVTLFRGFLDDFRVQPNMADPRASFTCLDALAKFRDVTLSTPLYSGISTGQAIGYILDAIGWPESDRDLDAGATSIRWWWEEGTDAFAALTRVVNSEGPGAFCTVDPDGRVVFRDRHHRLTRAASLHSQATFRDTGADPQFTPPLVYDHGWRDIVNSVTLSVDERDPAPDLAAVWTSDRTYSLSDGETKLLRVEASDPFYGAVEPESGTDYQVRSGTVTATLSRTSGASATIFLKATGGPAVVDTVQLRAYPIVSSRTVQVHAEDSTSIAQYGRRSYTQDAPWADANHAEAIADILLAQRAQRLPILTLTVDSVDGGNAALVQALSRDLSDRVTVVDSESGVNADFFVERIEHTVTEVGAWHRTTFGMEMAATQATGALRLGVGQLDVGTLGLTGLNDPDMVFRLDHLTQDLDNGLLAF